MSRLHISTFNWLEPTTKQRADMQTLRQGFAMLTTVIEDLVPAGPDRDYALRHLRETAMWTNVAIMRDPDGRPRDDDLNPLVTTGATREYPKPSRAEEVEARD